MQVYFDGLQEIGIYPEFLSYTTMENFQKQNMWHKYYEPSVSKLSRRIISSP